MARSHTIEGLLFWLMMLVGATTLVPCLVLPAWLDYETQRAQRDAALAEQAAERARLAALEKQIDHLENDPAYVLRLGEREFGDSIDLPHGETIPVAPSPESAMPAPQPPTVDSDAPEAVLPGSPVELLERYPLAQVFVGGATRPVLMVLGGALMLAAVVLLGRPGHRPPQKTAD
jgi:hypothetical protein